MAPVMCFTLDAKQHEFIPHAQNEYINDKWRKTFHLGPHHDGEVEVTKASDNIYKGILDLDYEKTYCIIIPETHPMFNAYLLLNYNMNDELFETIQALMSHPNAQSPIQPIRRVLEVINKQINKY